MTDRRTRATVWQRFREVLGTILLVIFAVVLGVVSIWQYHRRASAIGADPLSVSQCVAAYQRARTASDSAIVDLQRPINDRQQAANPRTCKQLRIDGALARDPSR